MTKKASKIGLLAIAGFALVTLAACNMVGGEEKSADNKGTSNLSTPAPAPQMTLAEMAALRLPLPSPRHRDSGALRVASIDPNQPLAPVKSSSPAVVVPPAPPAMATLKLSGAFLQYDTGLAASEKSKLNTPKEVRRVLSLLRYAAPDDMSAGWYAARAQIAAQNPDFIKGVKAEVEDKGVDKFLAKISDPAKGAKYVTGIKGAGAATQAVITAVTYDNARMQTIAEKFKTTSAVFQKTKKYGMQTPLPGQPVVQTADAAPSLGSEVLAVLSALSPISPAQADYSPNAMANILALAARQIATNNMAGAPLSTASKETSHCLTWARLNFNQCVAAAHFPSEEAWCTGKHAVDDVRKCWTAVLPPSAALPK